MTERITREDLFHMISAAATRVRAEHAALSELDSASGDGDHGAAMLRTVERLEKAFAPEAPLDLKACFVLAGWEVMGADGGASSALLGAFFQGMGDGLPEGSLSTDCRGLAAAFESGLQAVRQQTKAGPGDKTMMDALVPAVLSMSAAAKSETNVLQSLQEASVAARMGANATKELTARFGRARFLGEKTRGHCDPGAVSIALLFEGFCQGLMESKGKIHDA
jgi:phosphoenolpyruvate---glycerone phosphotransferase subunit DhaL